jgi:DNA-directed RNA polymerase subunit beta'
VKASNGELVVMSRNTTITVQVDGKDREAYKPPYGARLKVKDGDKVKRGDRLAEWDPYTAPIITEVAGRIRNEDLVDGFSVREETDEATGIANRVITDWRTSTRGSDLRPALAVIDADGAYKRLSNGGEARYLLPVGAVLSVSDGDEVKPGEVIARMPDRRRQDARHHRRSAAGGRTVRSPSSEGLRGHRRDGRSRRIRPRLQEQAPHQDHAGRWW